MNGSSSAAQTQDAEGLVDLAAERLRRRETSVATTGSVRFTLPRSDASTLAVRHGPEVIEVDEAELETELFRLARLADDGLQDDGAAVELSANIERLLEDYQALAVDVLSRLYVTNAIESRTLSGILPWLGRIEDGATHERRLWFLIYCLRDDHPRVRSSAALGLSSMEDPTAIPYLRREIGRERIRLLRARLEKVATDLDR